MIVPLILHLIALLHPSLSLSCYQCIRENLQNNVDPLFYNYDYTKLDSSCLTETKTCEDEGDEHGEVKCAAVTLSSDHAIGDSSSVESVDTFFCIYLESHITEDEAKEEICAHEGAEVGPQCEVKSTCVEDGCNNQVVMPHACSSCELPTTDLCQGTDFVNVVQSQCELVNCTTGVNQCYTKFNKDSCKVKLGCKPPDLVDCPADTCTICDTEECTLDKSSFCEPGSGCAEELPHECVTCTHSACSDPTEICQNQYQNCSVGVKECYTNLDSCSVTRGCKPPDFKCDDSSASCSVCKDDMCSLDTNSVCESGGECNKPITCNSCSLVLSDVEAGSWTDIVKENCSKQITCDKNTKECAIFKEDDCNFLVGCNEDRKDEKINVVQTFKTLTELVPLLEKLYVDQKDVIENCKNSGESDRSVGKGHHLNISLMLYLCSIIIALNYLTSDI